MKLRKASYSFVTCMQIPDSKATADSPGMDRGLLEAATSGKKPALHDPGLLLGRTVQGNTCLHIALVHGHEEFCKDILKLDPSLLCTVNAEGETPLLAAIESDNVYLASFLLSHCCRRHDDLDMREAMVRQDKQGCNALHHAIRRGHRKLALELIEKEPALTKAVNKHDESR